MGGAQSFSCPTHVVLWLCCVVVEVVTTWHKLAGRQTFANRVKKRQEKQFANVNYLVVENVEIILQSLSSCADTFITIIYNQLVAFSDNQKLKLQSLFLSLLSL